MARITNDIAQRLNVWLAARRSLFTPSVLRDRRIKALVYMGLTGNVLRCQCCNLCGKVGGFLWEYEIDHVQNDGSEDRKTSKKSAWYLAYLEAKAYGFDSDNPTSFDWTPVTRRFRVTCMVCNATKNPQTNKCNYQAPPEEFTF